MSDKRTIIFPILLCILLPVIAHANIVWPALSAETKVSSVPVIGLGIIIEFFFFQWLFTLSIKQALYYTIMVNAASGIIGIILRPLSGIVWELSIGMLVMWLFDWNTFNPVAWFFVPIFGGAVNAFIELLTIRFIWKHKLNKRNYILTWIVNTVTVSVATIWVILHPPHW